MSFWKKVWNIPKINLIDALRHPERSEESPANAGLTFVRDSSLITQNDDVRIDILGLCI